MAPDPGGPFRRHTPSTALHRRCGRFEQGAAGMGQGGFPIHLYLCSVQRRPRVREEVALAGRVPEIVVRADDDVGDTLGGGPALPPVGALLATALQAGAPAADDG